MLPMTNKHTNLWWGGVEKETSCCLQSFQ